MTTTATTALTILVVDDESSVRMILQTLLGDEGHTVLAAEDVATATEQLGKEQFDFVLLDKNLPDGTGLDIAQLINERGIDCEMAMMTAFSDLDSAIEAMRLGITEYIEKPFSTLDVVLTCVKRVQKIRRLKRENRQLVDDLQTKNAELEEMSVRDPLTQLFNHAFLQDSLEREVRRAARHNLEFSVLFIDVDNFKDVNDSSGHAAGDRLLKGFADILHGGARLSDISFRLRSMDIAARYGGDEFAVLLPETPKRGAAIKAERLREFVEAWDVTDIGLVSQTISIGVAAFPIDATTRAGLIDAADAALYAAKHAGRNRIVAFSKALPRFDAHGKTILEEEVRRHEILDKCIKEQDFDFVYQPIVHADSGAVYAYEALCRPRPEAFPHPGALIEAAESAGKIRELGRAIRARAVAGIEFLPPDALLFINLHPNELHDPDLVAVEPFMKPWASRVVFEITEVASIRDTQRLKVTLAKLAEAGFRIALDDLGSGYSSLNSLAMIEPHYVKLDMQLVRRISKDPRTYRLVRHIIEFALDEGMSIIAEGIETEEERCSLQELGCPLLQGYLFGKGVPASEIGS